MSAVDDVPAWRGFVDRMVRTTSELLRRVLRVLGAHDEGPPPSFQQMSLEIRNTIEKEKMGNESKRMKEETTLTFEHQLLMTWCWLNVRVRSLAFQ